MIALLRTRRARLPARTLAALALFAGAVPAAVAGPRGDLVVEPASPVPATAAPGAYPGFWQALEDAAFSAEAVQRASAEEQQLAAAVNASVDGRVAAAEQALRELAAAARDETVLRQTRQLLARLLMRGARWQEAEQVARDGADDSDGDPLLSAFRSLPPETVEAGGAPQSLPLELSRSGSPIVELSVNGRKQRFWIDTGAGLTVVASHVAEACGLRPLGGAESAVGTATTRVVHARPTVIAELRLGDFVFRNHPALILRRDDLRFRLFGLFTLVGIDGILGWPAIERLDLTIDLPAKKLTLRRPTARNEPRNLLWSGYPIVRVSGPAGEPLLFGLDTGGRRSSGRQRLIDKTGVAVVRKATRRVGGAGGLVRQEVRTLAPLTLGVDGCRLRFAGLETGEREHATILKLDGILGADLAGRARLRIDATNGRFDCVPAVR
jgi:hypothetical protein